jgi:hypothetical protein
MLLLLCTVFSITIFAQDPSTIPESSIDSGVFYRNVFKVNLFPMIGGRLNLAWEGGTKKMPGFEVSIEGLGIFANDQDQPKGFTGQLGYRKYIHKYSEEAQHPNSAFFLQPAFKIGYTNYYEYLALYDPLGNKSVLKNNVSTNFFIPSLSIGRQFVLHQRFSLDFVAGIGYFIKTKTNNLSLRQETFSPVQNPFMYGFYQAVSNLPLVGSASVRFGYLFN